MTILRYFLIDALLNMNRLNYTDKFTDIRNYLAGRAIGITRDKSLLEELVKCLFSHTFLEGFPDKNTNQETLAKIYRKSFAAVKKRCPESFRSGEELLLDPESIAYVHEILLSIDLSNPGGDPLGDLYQTFAGTEMRGNEGQFFTPPPAVDWIIEALDPKPGERLMDPACGAGAFLYRAARHMLSQGASEEEAGRLIFGIEKDAFLARLADTHLSLLTRSGSNVLCGDSIERVDIDNNALPINFEGSFDVVVANPPFGAKIKVGSDTARLRFDLARKWARDPDTNSYIKTNKFVPNPSPQVLFIEICIKLLKEGGRLGVVVPESMLSNSSTGHVVNYLMTHLQINAVIGMPENLFKTSGKGGTHTKTCLLIATKVQKKESVKTFFMAEAQWCGNDSRGKATLKNDLPDILSKYRAWQKNQDIVEDTHGYLVDFSRVRLNVLAPRYYDPRVPKILEKMTNTHQMINVGDLVKAGAIEIKTGDEVGKLSYGTGHIPFIRTSDISNWELKLDPKHGISEEIFKKYAAKQDVRENDIFMVRDGTYLIGTCALVSKYDTPIVYQSHLLKIRVNESSPISPFVLLALLSSQPVIAQIQSKRFTQDIIDTLGNRVLELILPIPKDLEVLEKIDGMVRKSIKERVESRELARQAKLAIVDPTLISNL